jgi:hypothetical protein
MKSRHGRLRSRCKNVVLEEAMKETPKSVSDVIQDRLQQLDIRPPPEDLPFLQRSFLRQREFLRRHESRLAPETEPAHVFKALP